ncbi:DUF262 domain-containing protein [Flexivirga alba]|uniref:DUF262 domain-containing protein n=1 Tax=Flexivirga alba TaxID=702742 RepID=A0ABW2AHC6_9MICO
MKAVDANLLNLLKKSTQFVVPIYQRVYSWQSEECDRLWSDVLHAGGHDGLGAHFTGSIVYVARGEGTRTSTEPDLIIDGQQRVTTVMLLLAALAARLDELPEGDQEPVEGFSPRKIRGLYLTNEYEEGDRFFKLILSKSDKEALKSIVSGAPLPTTERSRVVANYERLLTSLQDPGVDLVQVCLGLKKLIVVDVSLTRGFDDPQLVFETMNSTGKRLSQADLIRNFVLMDLPPTQQTRLYEDYWFPMEQRFATNEALFDEFVRHYLTLKTGAIPRLDDIYDAFKDYAGREARIGTPRDDVVKDLAKYATWFAAMALGQEDDPVLHGKFNELEQLRASVVYPFMLRVYSDYVKNLIGREEVSSLASIVTSYIVRRAVCQIPTNSHNKTFAGLAASIDSTNYVNSIIARFLLMPTYTRFPTDTEFLESLTEVDIYRFARASYLFRKLENDGRKEPVSTAEYTIEHIMPQNPNLSEAWQKDLGINWKEVQEIHLHRLGNLTLTGYNPEYSDRPFAEKRDMTGGFRDSPLRLNEGLARLHAWSEDEIRARGERLAAKAASIWKRPELQAEVLDCYRERFAERSGFNWSQLHEILSRTSAGTWTSYFHMAEAIGTSPQAVANHVARCTRCTNAYRVMTWDGRIASGFAWTDPSDTRDPHDVLAAEGLTFTDGIADPEQKLDTEDLIALGEE